MLKLVHIHTYYGDSYVLQGISLEVEKGSTVALLGWNGTGKTNTIRSIIGLTSARRGAIRFKEKDIDNVDGRGFHEQRYTARSWRRLLQGPVVEIDSQVYHGYIASDKAMKVRMLHCELKWEIPTKMATLLQRETAAGGQQWINPNGSIRTFTPCLRSQPSVIPTRFT